jgi:hypothetical protein
MLKEQVGSDAKLVVQAPGNTDVIASDKC